VRETMVYTYSRPFIVTYASKGVTFLV